MEANRESKVKCQSQEILDICVVGVGFVGQNLLMKLVEANLKKEVKMTVIGYDPYKKVIEENTDLPVALTNRIPKAMNYLVCVPTPTDKDLRPDLTALKQACHDIGSVMPEGTLVVFESTTYPGCTESICEPILKKYRREVLIGYAPERVNPGEENPHINRIRTLAARDKPTRIRMTEIYRRIGAPIQTVDTTQRGKEIQIAEMSKLLENTQRDVNIALMNEFWQLACKMKIDFDDVLTMAAGKYNFSFYKPGLVGGHCIAVDPYYAMWVARQNRMNPAVMSSARMRNNLTVVIIASQIMSLCTTSDEPYILILGRSYKPNVHDERESGAIKLADELETRGCSVTHVDSLSEIDPSLLDTFDLKVIAVDHKEFNELPEDEYYRVFRYVHYKQHGKR